MSEKKFSFSNLPEKPDIPETELEGEDEFVRALQNAKSLIEQQNSEIERLETDLQQQREEISLKDQAVQEKEDEIEDLLSQFEKIKTTYETINLKFEQTEVKIENLENTVEMKEEQIQLLQETLNMKNEQIKSKNEKIEQLLEDSDGLKASSEIVEKLESQIYEAQRMNQSLESDLLTAQSTTNKLEQERNEKEETIKYMREEYQKLKEENANLSEEMKLTRMDLDAGDAEIERLMGEVEQLQSKKELSVQVEFQELEELMKQNLADATHKVTLIVPYISDLKSLDLYSMKPTVILSIATNYDPMNPEHVDLLEEYRALENIKIKQYTYADRWGLVKDGEILIIGAIGKDPKKTLLIHAEDHLQIKLLKSLITDVWIRAKDL